MLCNCNAKPKLLIGQDNHHLITPIRCVRGKRREPYITQTSLGWCVHGYMVSDVNCTDRFVSFINSCTEKAGPSQSVFHVHTVGSITSDLSLDNDNGECTCAQLHDAVRRFFTLESIGVGSKPRRNPDEIRALQILDDTAELVPSQWTVGLPWKYDELHLPDSYPNAFNRLKLIERKFLLNKEYATRYCERMTYLFSNGYARELNKTDENHNKRIIWYLPHFGVDNPNKKKLRLVYDAAAKSNGYSLNDFLLQGPDLLQSLLGIMLRFRENRIGIIGDIKDMFLRINVRTEDVNSLRFLWKDIYLSNENEQLGFGSSNKDVTNFRR
ncbi:unnamed protein product [Parnassius mnemosyne]|uniref:Uncharacterized protein n=1 Tax=Parnassius mnemosyne TaxID=213953 RepID=A0AAV1KC54_9NEOP